MPTTHQITSGPLGHQIEDKGYAVIVTGVEFTYPERSHRRFSLGFSPAGRPARKVHQGPLHDELFGWINELPIVIADWHPAPKPVIVIDDGDLIVVEGYGTFRVKLPLHQFLAPTVEVVL